MGCPEIDWVAFLKNELPADEAKAASDHLLECSTCREEEESLRATLTLVRENLAPVEPSATFRKTLAERIRQEAESANANADTTILSSTRTSSRRMSASSRRIEPTLASPRRRSRYFFVSVALHTIVLVCVATWWISSATLNKSVTGGSGNYSTEGNGDPMDLRSMRPVESRLNAGFTDLNATTVATGVQIDISIKRTEGEIVLSFGRRVPCLFAYPSESEEQTRALLAKHKGSVRAAVENGRVTIPTQFAEQFAGDTRVRVFDLGDRLEFWGMDMWQKFEAAQQPSEIALLNWDNLPLALITTGNTQPLN